MTNRLTILRDTISGATMQVSEKKAQAILNHPVFGKRNIRVETPKPEVLRQPYTVEVTPTAAEPEPVVEDSEGEDALDDDPEKEN